VSVVLIHNIHVRIYYITILYYPLLINASPQATITIVLLNYAHKDILKRGLNCSIISK